MQEPRAEPSPFHSAGRAVPDLPVGRQLRILPDHACATTAQHDRYHVLPAKGGALQTWPRYGGW